MTSRRDPVEAAKPPAAADGPDAGRRALVRGAALLGVAGLAGVPLAACGGGGSDTVSADGPPPLPEAPAPTKPLPTKSQVYKRTPEPRGAAGRRTAPPRTAAGEARGKAAGTRTTATAAPAQAPLPEPVPLPKAVPAPAKVAEPAVGSKGSGPQVAARKGRPADAAAPTKRSAGGLKSGSAPGPSAAPTPSDDLSRAKTSDIPVGGGRVYPKEKVVVTQPTAGTFKGFSATCTHSGCLVSEVRKDGILCFCHGSRFNISDGTVLKGPAILPLPAEQVTVKGDRIVHGGHGGGHGTGQAARGFRRSR